MFNILRYPATNRSSTMLYRLCVITFQVLMIFLLIFNLGWVRPGGVSAAGTTHYVDNTNPNCSNITQIGTLAVPFCTISRGALKAVAGDTVMVLAGSYPETIYPSSGSAGSPITYRANPGVTLTGKPGTLTANYSAFALSGIGYVVIDGFHITRTSGNGIYADGSNHLTIINNHISLAGTSSIYQAYEEGIYLRNTTTTLVSGNITEHNSCIGIRVVLGGSNVIDGNESFSNYSAIETDSAGIELTGSSGNTITNNKVYANQDSGINIAAHSNGTVSSNNMITGNLSYGNGDHGIDNYNAPYSTVVANTVQGNGTVGINFEGVGTGSHHAIVLNNISVGNGVQPPAGSFGGNMRVDTLSIEGTSLDFNLYDREDATVQIMYGTQAYASLLAFHAVNPGQDVNSLEGNPYFVQPVASILRDPNPSIRPEIDETIGDYHMTAGSPAIDSANADAASQPTTDLDDNARVDDPLTANRGWGVRSYDDRGAYEYQPSDVLLPTVTTQVVSDITTTAVTGHGTMAGLGIPDPTQHGFAWSTVANPTILDNKTEDGPVSATGVFTSNITDLVPNTLYHLRAYATNAVGTSYGREVTFTTLLPPDQYVMPVVSSQSVDLITSTSAAATGNILLVGAPNPTQHGMVWSTLANPTIADSKTTNGPVSATGVFTSNLTGLAPNTQYYLRAYVTNAAGSAYGEEIVFTTLAPVVTTYFVDNTNPNCSESTVGPQGTSEVPFCTMGRAAEKAKIPGDIVLVVAGTYAETVYPYSGAIGYPITFHANPGVTVTGSQPGSGFGAGFALPGRSYVVIDGFNITNTWYKGIYVASSNHITLSNNHISHAGLTSPTHPYEQGIYLYHTSDSIVTGNTTDHNTCIGIRVVFGGGNLISNNLSFENFSEIETDAAGIELTGSSNNVIFNNTTYANEDSGINIYVHPDGTPSSYNYIIGNLSYGNGDHGIDHNNSPYNTVVGNTIQGNGTVGINFEGEIGTGSHHAVVMNNISVGNGFTPPNGSFGGNMRVDSPSVVGTTLDYNLYNLESATVQIIYDNESYMSLAELHAVVPAQDANSDEGNALFVDPVPSVLRGPDPKVVYSIPGTTGDYHLLFGSPAIDSANADAPNQPLNDIEGAGRVDDPLKPDSGVGVRTYDDLGAFEYQPVATSLPLVSTLSVSDITATTAFVHGSLVEVGVPAPIQHGVAWGLAANPTIADNKTEQGALDASGEFTGALTGLSPLTLYHVRAYATNLAGTVYGEDLTFTTLVPADEYSLTLLALGNGTISASPNLAHYHYGDVVTLTASPDLGWSFTAWSENAPGGTISMFASNTVSATFTQDEYSLNVISAQGTVTKSPNQASYHQGDIVRLSVSANPGWAFAGWTPTLEGDQVTINGNTTVTANYVRIEYALTITSEHGIVTRTPAQDIYYYGDVVRLSMVANPGWTFTGWTPALTNNQLTITGNTTVLANFTQNVYTLTLRTSGTGSITASIPAPYHYGDVVTLSAVPTAGWHFEAWSGDLVGTATPANIVINANKAVTATFARDAILISGNVGIGGATLTYTGGTPVTSGTDGSYVISVAYNWSGVVTPSKLSYIFTPTHLDYKGLKVNQVNQNYTSKYFIPIPAIPVKLTPTGTITDTTPTYTWRPSSGATYYLLRVYNKSTRRYVITDLQMPSATACVGTVCSWTPATVLGISSYQFGIAAVNSTGSSGFGALSTWKSFTVGRLAKIH